MMMSPFLILVSISLSLCADSSSSTYSVSYVEAALANISAQVNSITCDKCVSDSVTDITSVLQLSLLKQLLADRGSSSSGEQDIVPILQRMEILLNTTFTQSSDNQQAIVELSEQVSAMFSTLQSVKNDVKKILRSNNSNDDSQYTTSTLPHSCTDVKSSSPDSPSGYYTIIDNDGHTRHVYCDMSELCGSSEGWTRVAHLDMTDPQEKCPDGFKLDEVNGIRVCGRQSSGCQSTTFPSDGISYSEVCGRITGYQFGSPDGTDSSVNINGAYLDGVSLTHGNPRSHVWSFMGGVQENIRISYCPCGTVNPRPAPSFVGKHYFCESGATDPWQLKLYTDDPLWDGKGCGSIEVPCCSPSSLPWFYRSFTYSTDDYIEMRICGDEVISNEDVPVSQYEIYIK